MAQWSIVVAYLMIRFPWGIKVWQAKEIRNSSWEAHCRWLQYQIFNK